MPVFATHDLTRYVFDHHSTELVPAVVQTQDDASTI